MPERLSDLSITARLKSKYLINPENLPYFILPIVDYIHDFQPDCVMVLDTGARITGLAVFKLYTELYGPLPTLDNRLIFRRVSHKVPQCQVIKHIERDIEHILTQRTYPRLFIVDDWTTTGRTTKVVRKMIDDLSRGRIDVRFGVMREFVTNVADVHGDRFSIARSEWHHQPEKIGITYSPDLTPTPLRTSEAYHLRQKVTESVKKFTSRLKKSRSQPT